MACRAPVGLLLCVLLSGGCVTADSLMEKSESRGTGEESAAAVELAAFAADGANELALRCWALRSLSRLERVPDSVVRDVGALVACAGCAVQLRSWAAVALGEIRRKEAAATYVAALEGPIDPTTAYYVLEGLGKTVADLVGQTEEMERLAHAMTTFAAGQSQEPPEMYDLVSEHVVNLVVLAVALEHATRPVDAKAPPTPAEVYASVLRAMAHIEGAKDKYLASFARSGESVGRVIDLSFDEAEETQGLLLSLVVWYAGVLGDNREIAALAADRVVAWADAAEPRLRFLVAWSLARMELYDDAAGDALVARVLARETDDRVLRVLAAMSGSAGRPDLMQQILRVRTR